MLKTILRKRAYVLVLVLVLSMLFIATTAFAITSLVKAKKGGEINIAPGVSLIIYPGALEKNTVISADILQGRKRIFFSFGPDDTEFSIPAELCISWEAVQSFDLKNPILFGEDGERLVPKIRWWGVKYNIDHFSLYYYRRR